MQALPLPNANVSQMLFNKNMSAVVPNDSVSAAFQNLSALSGVNSMPQLINDMKEQMPAFLQQARLSTYYQDNPWPILTASNKNGVPTMGGDLIPDQPPGHRPGNLLKTPFKPNVPMPMQNMPMPNMPMRRGVEHFGNDEDSGPINWQ